MSAQKLRPLATDIHHLNIQAQTDWLVTSTRIRNYPLAASLIITSELLWLMCLAASRLQNVTGHVTVSRDLEIDVTTSFWWISVKKARRNGRPRHVINARTEWTTSKTCHENSANNHFYETIKMRNELRTCRLSQSFSTSNYAYVTELI